LALLIGTDRGRCGTPPTRRRCDGTGEGGCGVEEKRSETIGPLAGWVGVGWSARGLVLPPEGSTTTGVAQSDGMGREMGVDWSTRRWGRDDVGRSECASATRHHTTRHDTTRQERTLLAVPSRRQDRNSTRKRYIDERLHSGGQPYPCGARARARARYPARPSGWQWKRRRAG
jgi:hypothetical protein